MLKTSVTSIWRISRRRAANPSVPFLALWVITAILLCRSAAADAPVPRLGLKFRIPTHAELDKGPFRPLAVNKKRFWFSLGGAETSELHNQTIRERRIADTGLHSTGVAEWEYSFHHIKPGEADGAGYIHYGGYPTPPQTRSEAAAVVRAYYQKISADARAKATPEQLMLFKSINGHHCYQHYAAEWGCDIVGSEVGENINGIQAHIAFTRGAARQYVKPWLIDFSSWYGPSMYDEDPRKHWGQYSGPDRGHSLSLHQRSYYVAYMAGANVVIAEGGWLNFFRSQEPDKDGLLPLSRLGEAGARFYQFTQRHPDRGIPYIPIGLLIDFHHGIYPGFGEKLAWNVFPYSAGDQRVLTLWDLFFPGSIEVMPQADETGYMVASPFGDIVDVLLTNCSDSVLAAYPVLILAGDLQNTASLAPRLRSYVCAGGTLLLSEEDANRPDFAEALNPNAITDGKTFSKAKCGRGMVLVYSEDTNGESGALFNLVSAIRDEVVPFKISGEVQSLFNRTESGWMVALVNNSGITKQYNDPPVIDASAVQRCAIRYTGKEKVITAALCTPDGEELLEPKDIMLAIPPGEVRVIRIKLR